MLRSRGLKNVTNVLKLRPGSKLLVEWADIFGTMSTHNLFRGN